jgi:hypothetical protein
VPSWLLAWLSRCNPLGVVLRWAESLWGSMSEGGFIVLRRCLLPIIVVIGLFTPAVAQAAPPYERMHYSGSDSFPDTICGLDVTLDLEFSGVLVVRTVKGSDGQAFLAHNNYETVETITNPVTGNQIIMTANGVFHEQRAKHVSGNVWSFDFLDAGTFTVTDVDGNRLLRDRGVVKIRQLFDTLGDSQPGGELISEELLAIHGPHAEESTFCNVVLEQLT